MGFFGKKKKNDDDAEATDQEAAGGGDSGDNGEGNGKDDKGKGKSGEADGYEPHPAKAAKFFKHAHSTAETSQFDYSIDCFTSGLKFDPDNMTERESMKEVAMKRVANGGKKASGKDKRGAKTKLERMLVAEKVWAKDPLSYQTALAAMERAAEVDGLYEQLNVGEVAYWYGEMVMENRQLAEKPKADVFVKLTNLFEQVGAWEKAVEACTLAARLQPKNSELLSRLKDLEAEQTMAAGNYDKKGNDKDEAGVTTDSVKDMEKQRLLAAADAISKTERDHNLLIDDARKQVEKNPTDVSLARKLARLLAEKETDEEENEAIEILKVRHEETGEFAIKVQYQDIQIRQKNRKLRTLKKQLKANMEDKELLDELKEMHNENQRFEMEIFAERVENYRTDMGLRYELGKRQVHFRQFDDAVASFQAAMGDPKLRARAMRHLGSCYVQLDWMQEAVDTFEEAIELHPFADDELGKDMRYQLMNAYQILAEREKSSDHAGKAKDLASKILQTDINYRDIKKRINHLRQLDSELRKTA